MNCPVLNSDRAVYIMTAWNSFAINDLSEKSISKQPECSFIIEYNRRRRIGALPAVFIGLEQLIDHIWNQFQLRSVLRDNQPAIFYTLTSLY